MKITRVNGPPVGAHQQQGVALVISLIFLLVMTILGVTALNTSSLEESMARNLQETVRAFSNAETGVSRALQDVSVFTTADDHTNNSTIETLNIGDATYSRRYLGDTPPRRQPNTATGNGSQYIHFEVRSLGTTPLKARTIVDQGGYIEAPNPDGVLLEGP